jgi:hypothetical protein
MKETVHRNNQLIYGVQSQQLSKLTQYYFYYYCYY